LDHQLPDLLVNEGRSVLITRTKSVSGFTMIEMVVTLTIFGILVALTVPTMKAWIANTKVRAAADTLQNGMRLAQSEALRRSRQVVFALTNSTNPQSDFTSNTLTAANSGSNWVIVTIPAMVDGSETPVFVASGVLTPSGSAVATAGPAEVCFNSVGRLITNGATSVAGGTCVPANAGNNGSPPKYTYQVTMTGGKEMDVQLALGGQVHLCDPTQAALSTGNPYGC
jgi:type IV fimbrial biogenesis protein FimT